MSSALQTSTLNCSKFHCCISYLGF
jgi:hypothetical protein